MAFKKVTELSSDITISLGGVNRKTGKANPKEIEGFYLGRREIPDAKKKSGVSYIHYFETAKGAVAVWGKTNLDNQLQGVTPGVMTRATFDKMVPTSNGEMYKYKVEIDEDRTTEVTGLSGQDTDDSGDEPEAAAFEQLDRSDDDAAQEAALAAAERKARVQALLGGKKKSA